MNLMATTTSDQAYILGLSDNDPSNIVLMKTSIGGGLDPTQTTLILKISSDSFLWDTWIHLRLDSIVNPNGDVVLKCFKNNLKNLCTTPVWEPITGMADFVDDSLGIASSSNPLGGGYGGFFFQSSISGVRGFIDQFQMFRQM
jgi:hypothetical protein